MTKINIGPRITKQTADWYNGNFDSKNQGATYALEIFPTSYQRTLIEMKGVFTQGELSFFIDIMNGTAVLIAGNSLVAGQHLVLNAMDSFDLYPGEYEKKWKINKDTCMEKLRSLTFFQIIALETWSALFWAGDYKKAKAIEKHCAVLL